MREFPEGYEIRPGPLRPQITPLDGADVRELRPGEGLQLNLYWQPLTNLPIDYTYFLHLIDASGQTVAQRDTPLRAADYPTSHWRPYELAIDIADLPIPAQLAPGNYRLALGIYRMDTFERLAIPNTTDNELNLMTVIVRK